MSSTQVKRHKAKPIVMLAAVIVSVLWPMVRAHAQEAADRQDGRTVDIDLASTKSTGVVRWRYPTPVAIREGSRSQAGSRILLPLNPVGVATSLDTRGLGVNRQQSPQVSRERSTRRKILGGIVGGVGGFFGGMFLGAAIEGDSCDCDDPGFVGALIGGAAGAAGGGILGYKFLF